LDLLFTLTCVTDQQLDFERLEQRLKDSSILPLIVEQGAEMPMPD
jgi:hypothetical protein